MARAEKESLEKEAALLEVERLKQEEIKTAELEAERLRQEEVRAALEAENQITL